MRITVAIALFILTCTVGQAAFTDFSDFSQSQSFAVGETFQSQDLAFTAVDFQSFGSSPALFVGANDYSVLAAGQGVELLLPTGVLEVSLTYVDGAGSNIAINGIEPAFPLGVPRFFSLVDGTSLAGVSIETNLSTQQSGLEEGILTLRGPISSLVIAGIELTIDDVFVIVPEPSSVVLLFAASISLLTTRRRRYA